MDRSPSSAVRSPNRDGLDLRGAFVGSEGMFGVATKVCVRLMQNHPDVATMLMEFDSVADGAQLVSDIIAAGIVPAAVEMMDQLCLQAVEAWLHAGLPTHAAAALLIECVGPTGQVAAEVEQIRALAACPWRRRTCASLPTTASAPSCGRHARAHSARSPTSNRTTTCTTPSCRVPDSPR